MESNFKSVKILKASAGSGKTYALTSHYLDLIFSSDKRQKYREILAVTFTNKATEEMKKRILEELKNLAQGNGSPDLIQSILLKNPELEKGKLALKARDIYTSILHDFSHFSIMTLDSFAQKVIRSFAFELGLEPGFRVEIKTQKVKDSLISRLGDRLNEHSHLLEYCIDLVQQRLDKGQSWDFNQELKELSDELFKEVYQEHASAIMENLKNRDPNTFFKEIQDKNWTDQKAFEKRIQEILRRAIRVSELFELDASLFKTMSNSPIFNIHTILREEKGKLPAERIQTLIQRVDEPDTWFKDPQKDPGLFLALNPILKELKMEFERGYPEYVLNQAVSKNLNLIRLLFELNEFLKHFREENDTLLISDSQKLLSGISAPNAENPSFIWEKIGNRYKNYLLDEFQDTSSSQWNNLVPLIQESISISSGAYIENLLVGDVKQSIYRWRNGDWTLLHEKAKQDLGAIYVKEDSLEQNYRSRKEIIDFNNYVFQQIPQKLQESLNQTILNQNDSSLMEEWKSLGYDQILKKIYQDSEQKSNANTQNGGRIKIQIGEKSVKNSEYSEEEDEEEESPKLLEILQEIRHLKDQGYEYGEIAILVKKNKEVKQVLKTLLTKNIPVISGDALILGNNRLIQLILSTFYWLLDREDSREFYFKNSLFLLAQKKGLEIPMSEFMSYSKNGPLESRIFPRELMEKKEFFTNLPVGELFEQLIRLFEFQESREDIPYILGFRDVLLNLSNQGKNSLFDFLQYWEEEGFEKGLASGNNPNAIQITTIHKSKGLAFRAVLIPFADWQLTGMNQREFWVQTDHTNYQDLQIIPIRFQKKLLFSPLSIQYGIELLNSYLDSLNELYVALTRAKEYIFIQLNPAKKDDKKNGKKDLTYSRIGDPLHEILKDSSKFTVIMAGKSFEWKSLETPHKSPCNPHPRNNDSIILSNYQVTNRFGDPVLNQDLDTHSRFKTSEYSRKGRILHEILGRLDGLEQLDPILWDLRREGFLLKSELEGFRSEIRRILAHPGLIELFQRGHKSFKERNILYEKGKIARPDWVSFSNQKALLLDYKFTQEEKKEHRTQILKYAELLAQMGYPSLEAYLFYAETNSLIQVL